VIGHAAQAEEIFGFEEEEAVVAGEALPVLDFFPDGDQAFVGEMQGLTSASSPRVRAARRPTGRIISSARDACRGFLPPSDVVDTCAPVC
jgi:hypothetical protein